MTAFLQELFQFGFYKRSQGRVARQVTFFVLAIIVALGAWRLYATLGGYGGDTTAYIVSLVVLVVGCWAAFRVVHMPRFADFLISVEAEMNKVSWPTRPELIRASIVVILTIFILAGVLFAFDLLWKWALGWLLG